MRLISPATEIGALLDRYLLDLDTEKLDDEWVRGLFTPDARVEFPMSWHEGLDGLAAYHTNALAMFARTQHINSRAVVHVDCDDHAVLRANLVSTHVHRDEGEPLFATGTLVTGEARRTPDGWRLARLSFRLVWLTGAPPRATDRDGDRT